jgi:hypothetical protein
LFKGNTLPLFRSKEHLFNASLDHVMLSIAPAAGVDEAADPLVGPMTTLQMLYNMVLQRASMLAYIDQSRLFGSLVIFVIPLVFLLRRPTYDRTASLEVAH